MRHLQNETSPFALGLAGVGIAGAAAVIFALALAHEPVGGRLVTETDFLAPHPFISILKPTDRVEGGRGGGVIGSPVYFDVKPPSDFERVTLEVDYRAGAAPVVETGAMVTGDGRFDLVADRVALLEELGWRRVESGGQVLLQRNGDYRTVEEFFLRPPAPGEVAAFGTMSLPLPAPGNYEPSAEGRAYAVSLRGSHRLLVYLGDEALDLSFTVQDMNRAEGADPVRLDVYRPGEKASLVGAALADDGIVDGSLQASGLREVALRWVPPAPGYYLVDLDATDDVFIRSVETTARHFAFAGRVYLGDEVGYGGGAARPVTVVASGRRLTAVARSGDALQTIAVGERGLALESVGAMAEATIAGTTLVTVARRDTVIRTDGLIAFSVDALWPMPLVVDETVTPADLDAAGVNYVLAEIGGGALIYDTERLARTRDGAYRFALVAPGLTAADGLAVERVRLTWQRAPLTWGEWLRRMFTPDSPPDVEELSPAPTAVSLEERLP